MGLYDNAPLEMDDARRRVSGTPLPGTIRKTSASGKRYTVRHRPWWETFGPGPAGRTCGECWYVRRRKFGKSYFKCGMCQRR